MTLILSKAPTLGEEKGLEELELSLEVATSIGRGHEMFSAQKFGKQRELLFFTSFKCEHIVWSIASFEGYKCLKSKSAY